MAKHSTRSAGEDEPCGGIAPGQLDSCDHTGAIQGQGDLAARFRFFRVQGAAKDDDSGRRGDISGWRRKSLLQGPQEERSERCEQPGGERDYRASHKSPPRPGEAGEPKNDPQNAHYNGQGYRLRNEPEDL